MIKTATLALLAGSLAFAGAARADANDELMAAYQKFVQASSFRASMTDLDTGKAVNQVEFVAPDRFAISMEGGMRQVIIGRTMYMNLGGRTMSMPLPASIDPSQYRNQKALDELAAGVVVSRRDDGSVAGEPARVYHFVSKDQGKPVQTLTWVSKASGLPLQVQTDGGDGSGKFRYQIRYSDYNDPTIVIDAPK